jgi:hypothetical protein
MVVAATAALAAIVAIVAVAVAVAVIVAGIAALAGVAAIALPAIAAAGALIAAVTLATVAAGGRVAAIALVVAALVGAVAVVVVACRMRAVGRRGGRTGRRLDPGQQLGTFRRQIIAGRGLGLRMSRQSEQSRNASHGEQLRADRARRAEENPYHFLKSFEVNGGWTMTTQRTAPASRPAPKSAEIGKTGSVNELG